MALELNNRGKPRYIQKVRINDTVISIYLGAGDAGRVAHEQLEARREHFFDFRDQCCEIEATSVQLDKCISEIIEQAFINHGYISRQDQWNSVSRLRVPLTDDEKARIKLVKSSSIPCRVTKVPCPITDP